MTLIEDVVRNAELGDVRRNGRAMLIIANILEGHASATHGTQGAGHEDPWAHAMGAYRFFDNDDVSLPQLYGMSQAALQQLVPPGTRCYAVHDFSVLDYSKHAEKLDRIQVGNERGRG